MKRIDIQIRSNRIVMARIRVRITGPWKAVVAELVWLLAEVRMDVEDADDGEVGNVGLKMMM